MSMLHALQNKKKIELKDLWMSFRDLQKHMKFDMKKTEKIYNYLEKKLDGFI